MICNLEWYDDLYERAECLRDRLNPEQEELLTAFESVFVLYEGEIMNCYYRIGFSDAVVFYTFFGPKGAVNTAHKYKITGVYLRAIYKYSNIPFIKNCLENARHRLPPKKSCHPYAGQQLTKYFSFIALDCLTGTCSQPICGLVFIAAPVSLPEGDLYLIWQNLYISNLIKAFI